MLCGVPPDADQLVWSDRDMQLLFAHYIIVFDKNLANDASHRSTL